MLESALPHNSTLSNKTLMRRLLVSILSNFLLYSVLLFAPARTISWERAWILVFVITSAYSCTGIWLFYNNKALLLERLGAYVQKNQPLIDKVILITFLTTYAGAHAFIGYDVFFLNLLPAPTNLMSVLGLAGVMIGCSMVFLTMRENTFAAPVIKFQDTRQHQVVGTGIYRLVRHPMYAGMIPTGIGTALWLQSSAGALIMLLPIFTLVVRISVEERFLREHLKDYEAYSAKVRYRLIPYIW